MADSRTRIAPILLEAFFVVLGVSLALAGNEWRERHNDRARGERARSSILEEIQANRTSVQASLDYHQHLLDTLRVHMAPDQAPPGAALFREGFVRPTTALSTAWEAARATDAISHLDYEEVLAFSKLYTFQSRYERSALEAGTVLYAAILEEGVPGVTANYRNLAYIIGGFWYLEGQLLEEYDQVLSEIDADGVTPDSTRAPSRP